MHDLRTPVMIRVEASWVDHSGTLQTIRACIDDKSARGACIRVKTPIGVGSKLSIRGPWEQFSGVAKYCRSEGREYVVGIQRDPASASPLPTPAAIETVAAGIQLPEPAVATPHPVLAPRLQSPPKPRERRLVEMFPARPEPENLPPLRLVSNASMLPPRGFGRKTANRGRLRILRPPISSPAQGSYARPIELQANHSPERAEPVKERKHMGSKWFGLTPRHNKRDDPRASADEISCATGEKENFMSQLNQPTEKALAQSRSVPTFQVQLLAVEDIYRAAGIINPPRGYSVNKVVEMLHSEHIRGLSPEMRQAAVLMALDAAGVPLAQVQQDAKARQEALDTYEAAQSKQVDAEWARKAEEVIQIQAELESIKAHYMARISRNLEGVAREKSTFGTWQTVKQQEVESMAEAAELCSKAMVSRTASAPPAEASAAAAGGKV